MKPINVWIALSAVGHPAPIIGWAYTRKDLLLHYQMTFHHPMSRGGYRAVKATLVVTP